MKVCIIMCTMLKNSATVTKERPSYYTNSLNIASSTEHVLVYHLLGSGMKLIQIKVMFNLTMSIMSCTYSSFTHVTLPIITHVTLIENRGSRSSKKNWCDRGSWVEKLKSVLMLMFSSKEWKHNFVHV